MPIQIQGDDGQTHAFADDVASEDVAAYFNKIGVKPLGTASGAPAAPAGLPSPSPGEVSLAKQGAGRNLDPNGGGFLTAMPNIPNRGGIEGSPAMGQATQGAVDWAANNPAALGSIVATLPLGGVEGPALLNAATATAKWGPALGRFVLGASLRTAAAGAGGAIAAKASGQPNALAEGGQQALGQMAGEGLFGLGLPLLAKGYQAASPYVDQAIGKGIQKVADWSAGTTGGKAFRNNVNRAIIEAQDATLSQALDDYHQTKGVSPGGELPAGLRGDSRAAVENIQGYGAPRYGAAKVALDGAIEQKAASMQEASQAAMEEARKSARLRLGERPGDAEIPEVEAFLRDKSEMDITPISKRIMEIQHDVPRVRALPGGPEKQNLGLGDEFNKFGDDWLQMVHAADGNRRVPAAVAARMISNIQRRLLDPTTTREAANAMREILPMLKSNLEGFLGKTPEGQSALGAWKSANEFWASKQEMYKTFAWKQAVRDPEHLAEMVRPMDPGSVDVMHRVADEAGIPSLKKALSRQVLDKMTEGGSFGLADRLAEWSHPAGQGLPSTAGRLASLDPEFGKTFQALQSIAQRTKSIETMPTAMGAQAREMLANLATAGGAKAMLKSMLPVGAGAGLPLIAHGMSSGQGALAGLAVSSLPAAKYGVGYGTSMLLSKVSSNPQLTRQLNSILDGVIAQNPVALTNLGRFLADNQPKEKK